MSSDLVQVFHDTCKRTVRYKESMRSEKFAGILSDYVPEKRYVTSYRVVNQDCIEVCIDPLYKDSKVCCLNMASDYVPGGGVRKGSRAQEEHLCRCSGLYHTLNRFNVRNGKGPYLQHDEIIYSSNVPIIKDGQYNPLDKPVFVDFVSCAAIRNPYLRADGTYHPRDRKLMYNKVRQLIQAAAYYKIDVLVLGAFGCGAFYNPPEHVSKIFQEVLHEFDGCFSQVIFAILEPASADGGLGAWFTSALRLNQ